MRSEGYQQFKGLSIPGGGPSREDDLMTLAKYEIGGEQAYFQASFSRRAADSAAAGAAAADWS
jgi:hypothetical protein